MKVVSDLKKAGPNLKARCPFHKERTPSFNINPERMEYRCFGCGKEGRVLSINGDRAHIADKKAPPRPEELEGD